MVNKRLYDDGLVISYPEGDVSLERMPILLDHDLEDSSHTVVEGDTITSIAHLFYKDSSLWYVIADINQLDDIFTLQIGIELIIPNKKKIL